MKNKKMKNFRQKLVSLPVLVTLATGLVGFAGCTNDGLNQEAYPFLLDGYVIYQETLHRGNVGASDIALYDLSGVHIDQKVDLACGPNFVTNEYKASLKKPDSKYYTEVCPVCKNLEKNDPSLYTKFISKKQVSENSYITLNCPEGRILHKGNLSCYEAGRSGNLKYGVKADLNCGEEFFLGEGTFSGTKPNSRLYDALCEECFGRSK